MKKMENKVRGTKGYFRDLLAACIVSVLLGACGMESAESAEPTEAVEQDDRNTTVGSGSWEGTSLIGHSFGNVEGHSYTGCLEAFQERYELGIRTFEVDFSTASDGKLVLCHDWEMEFLEGIDMEHIPTSEEFRKAKIYGKYTPLTFTDLLHLMADYPDIWIVTDSKATEQEEVRVEFEEMRKEAEAEGMTDLLNRFIVQIYYEAMYDTVNAVYPFPNYIFTLYMRWDTDLEDFENICRWCVTHDIKNITMWNYLYNEKIRSAADRYGLDIFVHTENNAMAGANYLKSGVKGLYTDEIIEESLKEYSDMVKTIYFGGVNYNASDYVLEGLSDAEGDFTWTNGRRLYFCIPTEEALDSLRAEISVEDIYNDSQRYEVFQNGTMISNGTVTEGGLISFTVSAENCFCKFEVRLPDAVSPYETDGTEDERLLALLLKQATFYNPD